MSTSDDHQGERVAGPRLNVGDPVVANSEAPGHYRNRRGRIIEIRADGMECRVQFEDYFLPASGFLMAGWLDL